ncbi:MAG TPA: hypothetical protein VN540_03760 [Clostridia bacterium]|nr:hypothetical protein [Clostridia bacterium]
MANGARFKMRANAFVLSCALASLVVAALVGVLSLMVLVVGIIISLSVIIIRTDGAGTCGA